MTTVSLDSDTCTSRPNLVERRALAAALESRYRATVAGEMPAFRKGLVRRPALVGRLLDSREKTVVLIAAPAGYGKSTLLAEWAQADERRFISLKLDPSEDSPAHVAGSIAAVVEEASRISRDSAFVLVLDDAHVIRRTVLKTIVELSLEQLGHGSQLVLSTQREPPLPIGRLRAHRRLMEVRTKDLVMTPAEADGLLRLAGLELDVESVQRLWQRTEGWPVGLYLAALSSLEQRNGGAFVDGFDGEDHFVAEYLRDAFLSPLPREQSSFVIRTSVLDDLSGPVCDAVLGKRGSAVALDELARSNLMLSPLDRSHERFRWHGMLRATLRSELRRTEPDLEPTLRRRASTWLECHGDLDGAIGQAVAAGDSARAGKLLWATIMGYLGRGANDAVQQWLCALRPDQISSCAPLALVAAHSFLVTGEVDQALHWRVQAAAANERRRAGGEVPSFDAGCTIFDAIVATSSAGEILETATRAYELEPQHGQWRPLCCLIRGVGQHLMANRELAKAALDEGLRLGSSSAPSVAALCLAQLVMMSIECGDWETAGDLADRAAAIVARPALAAYPVSALVLAGAAATRAHQGRIDEAKQDLRRGTDLLAALGDFVPWYGAEARIMLARAALGLADSLRARTLLAEASRLARRTRGAVIFQRCFEQAWAEIDTLAETALTGPSSLTIAELRILRFLPSHRSFREIAERLDVSVNTVKTQAHAIYRKLDAASRSEAVARASSAGLLGA